VDPGVEFAPDAASGAPINEYELAQWRLHPEFAGALTLLPEEN